MINNIEDQIKALTPGGIIILETSMENAIQSNITAVKTLQDMGYEGVYVTFFKDYLELSTLMEAGGVNVSRLAFIDGITKLYGIREAHEKNVAYIDGPLSLDATLENISKMLASVGGDKKFVFLDSLTVVLLYNSLTRTIQFSKSLSDLLKNEKYAGIFTLASSGSSNETLVKEINQFNDKVIVLQ